MPDSSAIIAIGFLLSLVLGAVLIVYLLYDNWSLRKTVDELQDKNNLQETQIKAQQSEIALLRGVLTTYLEREKEISRDASRTEMLTRVLNALHSGGVTISGGTVNARDLVGGDKNVHGNEER